MNRGFTILELLVVIAIIGAMSVFTLIKFEGGRASARDARRREDIHQYQNALELYANSNSGNYPIHTATINPLTMCGSGNPLGAIACTSDPTGTNPYRYNSNAAGTQYVLWATLEAGTPANVFYVCSTGKSATAVASSFNPTNGTCP